MINIVLRYKVWLCIFLAVATITLAASCAKESAQALIAKEGTTTCDTSNVKYSTDVVPILSANCYSCHANGIVNAGVTLDGYTNVLMVVSNGYLVGAITHAPGFVPMPFDGASLSDCDIATIKAWINAGAPNN